MEPRSEFFDATGSDGVRLHRLCWGEPSSPTLVLLHGGGANAHWWAHLAPDLARHGYRVVALDFRGHGSSDFPAEVTPGAFTDDLRSLLVDLGSPSVSIVGHSMGAGVALDFCSTTAIARRVVLLDPARGGASRSRRTARLALTLRRTYRSREEAERRYRFFPAAEHVSEDLRASIAAASVGREPDGRYGYKFDPRWFGIRGAGKPDLSGITSQVLIVRGEESDLLTREGARALAAELPSARIHEIASAGHHVHLDQPAATLAALKSFL